MSVSNLTNTTWEFISDVEDYNQPSSGTRYYVNFVSNNESFNSFDLSDEEIVLYTSPLGYQHDKELLDVGIRYLDNTYTSVHIIDGTDVTNNSLIAWLEANATLVVKLDTPVVSISNDVLQWDAIEHATHYQIYKDNTLLTTITAPIGNLVTYTFSTNGIYQVKAHDDNAYYDDSDLSNSINTCIEITLASTPTVLATRGTYNNRDIKIIAPLSSISITDNGTYTPSDALGFNSVTVAITLNTQSKTVTPTENLQTITPDANYNALNEVIVNPIPSQYYDTSNATAIAADLRLNKIAYGASGAITGTIVDYTGDTLTSFTIPAVYLNGHNLIIGLPLGAEKGVIYDNNVLLGNITTDNIWHGGVT